MPSEQALVLIHSPAVGPDSWERVAAALAGRYHVVVPSLMGALVASPPYWQHQALLVRSALATFAPAMPIVLVGHSGAGPLLPLIAVEVEQPTIGYVFVDAGLPAGSGAWLDTAPPALADRLRTSTIDGWVPPWADWWDEADLAEEIPDDQLRARFRAGLEPLPLAMFEEIRPATPQWPDAPCAYLQLSGGYRSEAALARERGWPTIVLESTHMAPLTDSPTVAKHLDDLVGSLE